LNGRSEVLARLYRNVLGFMGGNWNMVGGLYRNVLVLTNGNSYGFLLHLVGLNGNNTVDFVGFNIRNRGDSLDSDVVNLLGLDQPLDGNLNVLGLVFNVLSRHNLLDGHTLGLLNRCHLLNADRYNLLRLNVTLNGKFDFFGFDLLGDDRHNLLDLELLNFAHGGDRFNTELLNFFGADKSLVGDIDFLILNRVFLNWNSGADSNVFVILNLLNMFVFHGYNLFGLDVPLDGYLNLL